MKNKGILGNVKLFLSGCLMGISDAIPGVSGATIAIILGIYEELISSISFIFSNLKKPLELIKSKELKFLLNIYSGVLIALFIILMIINYFISNYKEFLFSFFIGLIIASIFVLINRNKNYISNNISKSAIFGIIGIVIGFLIMSLEIVLSHSYLIIFISGFLAISAMILPGISGSYVLLMMNQYEFIVDRVTSLDFLVILVLGIGMFIGLFIMSKIISKFLKKYHDKTIILLIGLMIGGMRGPISQLGDDFSILFGIIGCLVILAIDIVMKKDVKSF